MDINSHIAYYHATRRCESWCFEEILNTNKNRTQDATELCTSYERKQELEYKDQNLKDRLSELPLSHPSRYELIVERGQILDEMQNLEVAIEDRERRISTYSKDRDTLIRHLGNEHPLPNGPAAMAAANHARAQQRGRPRGRRQVVASHPVPAPRSRSPVLQPLRTSSPELPNFMVRDGGEPMRLSPIPYLRLEIPISQSDEEEPDQEAMAVEENPISNRF